MTYEENIIILKQLIFQFNEMIETRNEKINRIENNLIILNQINDKDLIKCENYLLKINIKEKNQFELFIYKINKKIRLIKIKIIEI